MKSMGVEHLFEFTEREIRHIGNGTTFIFKGIRNSSVDDIKSCEGVDYCWIEEGQNITGNSLDVLIPTIRKKGSEIWISFNPDMENDAVYKEFVVKLRDDCILVKINYDENPDCPDEIKKDAADMLKTDPAKYRHIYLGEPNGVGSRVFPTFTDQPDKHGTGIHVRAFDIEELARSAQTFMAMDPHTVYFPFMVWIARIPKGKEFMEIVYNEFPTLSFFDGKYYHEVRNSEVCTLPMIDLANMIKVFDQTIGDHLLPQKITERYVDTRFAKASGARSWSTQTDGLVAEFANPRNGGMVFKMPPERMIDVQRDNLREMLKYNENIPMCSINEPRFFVMPHCKNVIASLKFHRFNIGDSNRAAGEDDKYKDPSDAVKICKAGMEKVEYKHPEDEGKKKPFLLTNTKQDWSHSLT